MKGKQKFYRDDPVVVSVPGFEQYTGVIVSVSDDGAMATVTDDRFGQYRRVLTQHIRLGETQPREEKSEARTEITPESLDERYRDTKARQRQAVGDGANVYQYQAHATAVYRQAVEQFVDNANRTEIVGLICLLYAGLGLASEAGEVAGKLKKFIRDDGCHLTAERRDATVGELGGVRWYQSEIATLIGVTLGHVDTSNLDTLADRQRRGKLHGDGDHR